MIVQRLNGERPFVLLATMLILAIAGTGGNAAWANDTAADITPQGLNFKQVKEISIEEENLFISQEKIEVAYLFRNSANKDVTVEVAFPVPPYGFDFEPSVPDFQDFSVEVDGRKLDYLTDTRALVGRKDFTGLLTAMGISIADFGNFDVRAPRQDLYFFKLQKKDRETLLRLGIASSKKDTYGWPQWTVSTVYHWTQTFPASRTLSIRHSYTPHAGYRLFSIKPQPGYEDESTTIANDRLFLKQNACADDVFMSSLERSIRAGTPDIYADWVRYILQTANNWRQPIRTFHLTVEAADETYPFISFCFPVAVKENGKRYTATARNFVPGQDLEIYFFQDERLIR